VGGWERKGKKSLTEGKWICVLNALSQALEIVISGSFHVFVRAVLRKVAHMTCVVIPRCAAQLVPQQHMTAMPAGAGIPDWGSTGARSVACVRTMSDTWGRNWI